MADNHLKLNEKTQIIWPGQQLNKVTARALTLPNATVEFSTTVKDLGVALDSVRFVSSRIDYCYSILAGVSGQLLQRLQSVQNAATRLVTGTRRSDRMTPILRQLHWLPVHQRIIFKTAVLVYKCLHGMAPPYLSTYCEPTSSHGQQLTWRISCSANFAPYKWR